MGFSWEDFGKALGLVATGAVSGYTTGGGAGLTVGTIYGSVKAATSKSSDYGREVYQTAIPSAAAGALFLPSAMEIRRQEQIVAGKGDASRAMVKTEGNRATFVGAGGFFDNTLDQFGIFGKQVAGLGGKAFEGVASIFGGGSGKGSSAGGAERSGEGGGFSFGSLSAGGLLPLLLMQGQKGASYLSGAMPSMIAGVPSFLPSPEGTTASAPIVLPGSGAESGGPTVVQAGGSWLTWAVLGGAALAAYLWWRKKA